jgi:phosphoglycerate dehydrogenase-like enzyme
VFEHEPLPVDDPLIALPNVVTTGHAATFTHLGLRRTGAAVIANLRELVAGTLPRSCLNPRAWSDTTP